MLESGRGWGVGVGFCEQMKGAAMGSMNHGLMIMPAQCPTTTHALLFIVSGK